MLKTSRNFIRIFLGVALFVTSVSVSHVSAQSTVPTIEAKLEPDSIVIGDQFRLNVTVTKDLVQMVDFPVYEKGMIGENIEILNEGEVDTLARDGRMVTLKKSYLLTCFDQGQYSLGKFPMLYADKNIVDTIWSRDSIVLKVATFDIDTTKQTIYDIREPLRTPVKFGELSGYIIWGLVIAALITLLVLYIIKRRKNMPLFGKPTPADPPHVAAIKALEALHHQKVWQNNKHKLYYTRLTDIIREYMEARYLIHALEMTSDEILVVVEQFNLPQESNEELRRLLKIADMVKFAKYIPEPDQNEAAYTAAYYFVEQTKPNEVEPKQPQIEEGEL